MKASFPFEKRPSIIFGQVYRPIAIVSFWSPLRKRWSDIPMIVDTGADYTILPRYWAENLGINLEKEAVAYRTSGIGGEEKTYFLKSWKIKINEKEMNIPLGFLERDNIPPLLGRQGCLETLRVLFVDHTTTFEI